MVFLRHVIRIPLFLRSRESQRLITTGKYPLLAGHSKWANIRHIKAEKDGERASLFLRMGRQIRLAIQEYGSADPAMNNNLRSLMDQALRKNMPMASIQNTIKKCQQSSTQLKRYTLELKYKQKVYMVCTLFTDNFPMAKQEMATLLRKNGAVYSDVSHLFDEVGVIETTLENAKTVSALEERVTEDAIECGAEDVEVFDVESGLISFFCSPHEMNAVRNAIESKNYKIDGCSHIYTPNSMVELTESELKAYNVFVDKLKNLNGVEDIFDNVNVVEA